MTRISRLGRPAVVAALGAAVLIGAASGARSAAPGWTRIAHSALEGEGGLGFVSDVQPPSNGRPWLLGGWTVDTDGIRTPAIWESKDGGAWKRRALPPSPAPERRDAVDLVARRGSIEVALGNRFDGLVRNAAWYAVDGRWRAVMDARDPLLAFDGRIAAVATTSAGFVAVAARQQVGLSQVRLFASRDGRRWDVRGDIPLPDGYLFRPFAVAVAGERIVVAGMTRRSPGNGDDDAAIWTWADGSWTRVDPVAAKLVGSGRDDVGAVAYRRGIGFVAGGMATRKGVETPVAWVSADGLSWTRLPAKALSFPSSGAAVHDIAATTTGFVAAGNSSSGVVVWRSTTGRRWTAVTAPKAAHEGGERITTAALGGAFVVAVLQNEGSDVYRRSPSGRWSVVDRPPAFPQPGSGGAKLVGIAVAGNRLVAVGNDGRGLPLVMLSRNGRAWTRGAFSDRAAHFSAVAANRGTIAIAGWRWVRGLPKIALWTSVDGHSWKRLGGVAAAPTGGFADIAPDGRGFAAVAYEGSGRGSLVTSVWFGDRRSWNGGDVLGAGEARAVCVGPHGATAIAMRDGRSGKQVVAWQRVRSGTWSRDADVVAAGSADANRCEDLGFGTVVVGSNAQRAAAMWTRSEPGDRWNESVLSVTNPFPELFDVTRAGRSALVTGSTGARGQLDLYVWRTDGRSGANVGGGDPLFAAPGAQGGLGIAFYRGRIVVVGQSGAADAAIWVGRDAVASGPAPGGLGG